MTIFKAAAGIAETKIGEDTVLLHLESGEYFGLNEVGSFIWRLLKEGMDVNTIASTIADSFSSDLASITKDVGEILDQLVAENLIVAVDDAVIRSGR